MRVSEYTNRTRNDLRTVLSLLALFVIMGGYFMSQEPMKFLIAGFAVLVIAVALPATKVVSRGRCCEDCGHRWLI